MMAVSNQDEYAPLREVMERVVGEYEYIHNECWFMLEPFCVYLVNAMLADGIPRDQLPDPLSVFQLFYSLHDEQSKIIGRTTQVIQDVVDIPDSEYTETLQDIFPYQVQTYVHCTSFTFLGGDWIWRIAEEFLPSLHEKANEDLATAEFKPGIAYGRWAKDLPLTRRLIEGYFEMISHFMRYIEGRAVAEKGYGNAEMLIATWGGENGRELVNRGAAVNASIDKAQNAFKKGFYIECTVLCECIITRIINEIIVSVGGKPKSKLYKLVKMFGQNFAGNDEEKKVVLETDFWRARRNQAVHNYVTSQISSGPESVSELDKETRMTAEKGLELALWYVKWRGQWALKHILPII
ncbi:hypothetical protein ACMG4M_05840 [Alcanivorax sp. IL3]|uniref:hypothetical protein n=1 Tax=unclassified Alcanivorax TaxID=2638842 RepID=UPI0039C0132B